MSIRQISILVFCILTLSLFCCLATISEAGIIFDHTAVDLFDSLTATDVSNVQDNIRWHYAHTSHGGQITIGLQRIEDAYLGQAVQFNISRTSQALPTNSNSLNIFDGQQHDTYITPDEYWSTGTGIGYTNAVLSSNPSINVSQWSWCTQMNSYNPTQTQAYLTQIAAFEAAHPDVVFIYMTGTAEDNYQGSTGYNRYQNNQLIRSWVRSGANRILFDFADLDAWAKDPETGTWSQNTYSYNDVNVPTEHSALIGSGYGHTSALSAEQKAKASWVMMDQVYKTQIAPEPISTVLFLSGGLPLGLGLFRRKLRGLL